MLGSPIDHSRSPILHNAGYAAAGLTGWEYTRIETTAESLARVVGEADDTYVGFSVTMPAKFAALEFADEVTERAAAIGSANTLMRTSAGWRADNTDCDGAAGALGELFGSRPAPTRAVIVGAGGTARPAFWALADLGVTHVTVLNRSDRRAELAPLAESRGVELEFLSFDADLLSVVAGADVLISTVPSAGLAEYVPQLGHIFCQPGGKIGRASCRERV